MFRRPPTFGRLLTSSLLFAAPAWLALAALALGNGLDWGLALLAGLFVQAGIYALLRRQLRDLADVAGAINAMAEQEEPAPPRLVSGGIAADLLAAAQRLDRSWRERIEAARHGVTRYKTVFDNLPEPLLLLDSRRRIVFGNFAMRQLLGNAPGGSDLAGALRDPRVLEAVDAVLGGGGGRSVPFRTVEPAREFEARVEPLRDQPQGGAACVVAMVDLTAIKRMDQMRSDFIANASHELRTPLTSLIGFIETLRGPARDDAKAREQFLELMQQQASRMARLVRDLLSLSTIELSERTPPSARIDVAAVLQSVAAIFQLQARDKKMSVEVTVEADLPEVLGDADQLAQVFQNLIDNAIKYGAPGSPVTVAARVTSAPPGMAGRAGDGDGEIDIPRAAVAVAVNNRGEAIAKEHLPRLTERFYRIDTARSRTVGGTGLGLAIVKHVVNRHRGALVIDSEPAEGTTVTVYLPLAPDGKPGQGRQN